MKFGQFTRFFTRSQVANVKNCLKIKQLAKQDLTLKTLLQKNFGRSVSKEFYFFGF